MSFLLECLTAESGDESFLTVDGTAKTSDQDYVARTGTRTFAPGETTKTITIVVNGDDKKEAAASARS